MEAPFVPDSHEFSSFTNATRVTPREKIAKSYMFILDTPEQSSKSSVISHEEHDQNEAQNRKVTEARELVEAWSNLQLEVDLSDRAERRNELVAKYYDQYLGHLERLRSGKVPILPIECEQCLEDLKSPHPSPHIQEYKQMMSSRFGQSQMGSTNADATDVNVAAFDELTSHLAATIEEHEQKLQKLEKRLKELSAGRNNSVQHTDELEQDPINDVETCNNNNSWPGTQSTVHVPSKDLNMKETVQKTNEQGGYQLSLDTSSRYLVTDDWLKFAVDDSTLYTQQQPTDPKLSGHEGVEDIEEEEDVDMPAPIRSVFLSNLVWDDDGDVGKRVDWQLRQYQKMAYKPRNRWSPKITIPQPFNMTIREYTRPKSETYAQQRMEKIKEAQDAELKVRIRPTDVPKSTTLPKFQRIMEEKQKRSVQIREQSKENLLKNQRPFSFYSRSTTSSLEPSENSTSRHNRCLQPMDDIYL